MKREVYANSSPFSLSLAISFVLERETANLILVDFLHLKVNCFIYYRCPTGQPSEWKNVALQGRDARGDTCQVDSNSVSVLVDHFSAFSLVGRARPHTRGQATKRMLAAVFAPPPRVNDDWALNVVLMDDTEAAFKVWKCLLCSGRLCLSIASNYHLMVPKCKFNILFLPLLLKNSTSGRYCSVSFILAHFMTSLQSSKAKTCLYGTHKVVTLTVDKHLIRTSSVHWSKRH